MLYLIIGNREQRLEELRKTIGILGTQYELLEHRYSDEFKDQKLEDTISLDTGLFGGVEYYVFHELASYPDRKLLQQLQESPNYFFFLEEKVLKKTSENFLKVEAKIIEFKEAKVAAEKKFNVFALADALGERDKKKLWLLYHQALEVTDSPEEINGILLWQLKNLALIHRSPNGIPDMNPYVYTKNVRYSKNFTFDEVLNLMNQFTTAFHRRDTFDTLEIKIERIILSL